MLDYLWIKDRSHVCGRNCWSFYHCSSGHHLAFLCSCHHRSNCLLEVSDHIWCMGKGHDVRRLPTKWATKYQIVTSVDTGRRRPIIGQWTIEYTRLRHYSKIIIAQAELSTATISFMITHDNEPKKRIPFIRFRPNRPCSLRCLPHARHQDSPSDSTSKSPPIRQRTSLSHSLSHHTVLYPWKKAIVRVIIWFTFASSIVARRRETWSYIQVPFHFFYLLG